MGHNQGIEIDGESRIGLLYKMQKHFDVRDIDYFKKLLGHEDNVIRTRAVCILAEIGGRRAVKAICDTLKNDKDALVRHEAAFALGQLGKLRHWLHYPNLSIQIQACLLGMKLLSQ
ncbi:MAG TPA: HEAT repeat domain-containing protein [Nitrososphaeraceae archaeon]|nr:HEAT repeat domain-containing protein [Nitrososphaeraceae archaeon]